MAGKVTLLTARQSKGLEFDHVILAEPAGFLDEAGAGLRHLYVALTRATQTLHVVHARDLRGRHGVKGDPDPSRMMRSTVRLT